MADPIKQFVITPLHESPLMVGGMDLSFTNSSLWMVLSIVVSIVLIGIGARKKSLVPGRMQALSEIAYEFVADMVKENIGSKGRQYFPFVFSIFMFVLMGNVLGLIPWSFTITSHIIVTGILAVLVFVRLFANMMAGHLMVKIFASFSVMLFAGLGATGLLIGIVPVLFNSALLALELLVACLQAYIFAILSCIYLKDSVDLHH